jgi:O-antigen/teichoic acid export membrane protein
MDYRKQLRVFLGLSIGHLTSKAVAFGTTVVLARALSRADLGSYAAVVTVFGFAVATCNWGTDALGIRAIATNPEHERGILRAVLLQRGSIAILLGIVAFCVGPLVGVRTSLLFPALATLLAFAPRRDWLLLSKGDARGVGLALLCREITLLSLALLVVPRWPALGTAIWCYVGADLMWTVSSYLATLRTSPERQNEHSGLALKLTQDGWPIAIVSVMTLANNKIDVPLLAAFRGAGEAAPYWAAYNLLFASMAIAAMLTRSALPQMARHAQVSRDHEAGSAFYLALVAGVVGGCAALVLFAAAGPLMNGVYGSGLQAGASALNILALALPAHFVAAVLIGRLVAEGRQRSWTVAAGSAGALNLLSNMILIPRIGMVGAAASTVLSEWCLFAIVLISFRRHALYRPMLISSGSLFVWVAASSALARAFGAYGCAVSLSIAVATLLFGMLPSLKRNGLRLLPQVPAPETHS